MKSEEINHKSGTEASIKFAKHVDLSIRSNLAIGKYAFFRMLYGYYTQIFNECND